MEPRSTTLGPDELEQLQAFLKEWLRVSGRNQSDLARALGLTSTRMLSLLEELVLIRRKEGLAAVAECLCAVEAVWARDGGVGQSGLTGVKPEDVELQLDLLLNQIRLDAT
ncbi:MAG: hypothetical protein ERJ67_04485 [Aphanocapsa feldmannii 277cV]|uniref:Uncharacterized protein n=2 Tax=Aphanocapsa feldmannii TaxID=192050 RepID=A0A524RNV8_9CHRO|nr:MAG: hypothetical protein ERJ69_06900 [Aphanocapsa feldmannii 288cV]TGG93026.1 MAG: hypothetical protein ERJ67_04485 [Aphanocapsa feldmannii 277cV]TGH23623.1 MAG: hypothetical protein ERJ68_03835 [Aphanocapsa feldmannii 277cI]